MSMTRQEILEEAKSTLEEWLCDSYTHPLEGPQHYIAELLNDPDDPADSLTIEVREERFGGGEAWFITLDARKVDG